MRRWLALLLGVALVAIAGTALGLAGSLETGEKDAVTETTAEVEKEVVEEEPVEEKPVEEEPLEEEPVKEEPVEEEPVKEEPVEEDEEPEKEVVHEEPVEYLLTDRGGPEKGIALCLSGGGYRAMVFHTGGTAVDAGLDADA